MRVGRLRGAHSERHAFREKQTDDLTGVGAQLLADHDAARQLGGSSSAPRMALWSVMHSTSMPDATTASSTSSGVVVQSPDHIVWECRSTRTQPGRTGCARCGWRSIASALAAGTRAMTR